ncbi:MAG: response regulator transcription factor [Burkholderiaceae bacterium]
MTTCLIVDDDPELRGLVADHLARYGLQARQADSAAAMRVELQRGGIDIILLDVMLPDGDGIELCRDLRTHSKMPVIMLTAQGDPITRVLGLEIGADDVFAKPFEPRELLARIHALMRRSAGALAGPQRAPAPGGTAEGPDKGPAPLGRSFGGWQIDWRNRMLIDPENVGLSLSNVEYRLLAAFAEHPGEVLTRPQLVELTRGAAGESNERGIDLAVSRLRAKLRESPEHPRLIHTVRGRGYQFTGELTR